jgi:hypothetical protein
MGLEVINDPTKMVVFCDWRRTNFPALQIHRMIAGYFASFWSCVPNRHSVIIILLQRFSFFWLSWCVISWHVYSSVKVSSLYSGMPGTKPSWKCDNWVSRGFSQSCSQIYLRQGWFLPYIFSDHYAPLYWRLCSPRYWRHSKMSSDVCF